MKPLSINIKSEIGKLQGVIVHRPGKEIENMTPENAGHLLYNDLLSLSVALPEYDGFLNVLKQFTEVYEIAGMLTDVVSISDARNDLFSKLCKLCNVTKAECKCLEDLTPAEFSRNLIEGVEMKKNTLTAYISNDKYRIKPLPNLFFARDANFAINDTVFISKMASNVRMRETVIMETIFKYHPAFSGELINLNNKYNPSEDAKIEGGDVLVAREDILIIGDSARTNSQGIDMLLEHFKTKPGVQHIIVQELPYKPESFIHLDMTFTFLDVDKAMIYKPLILDSYKYRTFHITIDGNKVTIKEDKNILNALQKLGIDLEPVFYGGSKDVTLMMREQWQSGANFFALQPGVVIGYERNEKTIEAMHNAGFEVLSVKEVLNKEKNPLDYSKAVITIKGNELSRGGGGARCMTMPVNRAKVDW